MTTKSKRIKLTKNEEVQSNSNASSNSLSSNSDRGNNNLIEQFRNDRLKTAESVVEFNFIQKRARILNGIEKVKSGSNGILYWMFRDQRVQDNWAFLLAQKLGSKNRVPLHVCFCLLPNFLDANMRHYRFLVKGLQEVEEECRELNIHFHLLAGNAGDEVPKFVRKHNIGAVVCDLSPLRIPMQWVESIRKCLPEHVPLIQVDSHNIVPVWEASPKQEYAARTIRNKINNQLKEYLTEFPPLIYHPFDSNVKTKTTDWKSCWSHVKIDELGDVDWATPGYKSGIKELDSFCKIRLKNYATKRNNPLEDALSMLSPWLHFGNFHISFFIHMIIPIYSQNTLIELSPLGQISPQRCILEVSKYRGKYKENVDAFCEETIIRRELSDNFCFYNKNYDSLEGAENWARVTLNAHRKDKREHIYTLQQFKEAQTHDDLWNSAQLQLNKEGKMHGFLRMYWAKKILEWTESPEKALEIAIYLNDYYSLDGRDPNGYVGMCEFSVIVS